MNRLKIAWLVSALLIPMLFVVRNFRFEDDSVNWHYITYIAPIYLIVILAAGDRYFAKPGLNPISLSMDGLIILGAALRMFPALYYPPFSGHALFLSYVIISARMWPFRLIAAGYTLFVVVIKFGGLNISTEWLLGGALGAGLGIIFKLRDRALIKKEHAHETDMATDSYHFDGDASIGSSRRP